jgi:hypothetical protein
MSTTPPPTRLTRVARQKLDLFNKIDWKNQRSIQHYLLGANAKYKKLQVPVWRIGHASGVFVVTQAEEWFLMTKEEQKLERDGKRLSISKYDLKKLRKAIPSHAGDPFGLPPPAAAIPPAAAPPDDEGAASSDQPSISMPPPSTRGPSARTLIRHAIEASQQPMLQQRAREVAGYVLPNPSGEDEEPHEEPAEDEQKTKRKYRKSGKRGWDVHHQNDAMSIAALDCLLRRQGTYTDTTDVENAQDMNVRVQSGTIVTIEVADPLISGGKTKRARRDKTLVLWVTRDEVSSKTCLDLLANASSNNVQDQYEFVPLFAGGPENSLRATVDEYIKSRIHKRSASQNGALDIASVREHIDDSLVDSH